MKASMAVFEVLLGGLAIGGAWYMTSQLAQERGRAEHRRWLSRWAIKGLAAPFLVWALMNVGLSFDLQPFMPEVQIAQNRGGNWFPAYCGVLSLGIFILGTFWGALTLAWALARMGSCLKTEELRAGFKSLCWTCGVGLGVPGAILLLVGGWPLLGLAAGLVLAPLSGYTRGLLETQKRTPIYARAIAKMKFGKYTEAEWEIIHELERCEDDFEGWMMLADLYANHFNDLTEASQTIFSLCAQPKTTPSQAAVALHRLADWHLKLAGDPEGARRTLQIICDRFPGSHLDRMARVRLEQLPRTAEEFRETQTSGSIPLPALGDQLDQPDFQPASELDRRKAAQMANRYVERLKRDPNQAAVREKLARLLAERLDRVDSGLEQLALLLDMPGQPVAHRAEWLGLTAAWHLKYRHDALAARRVLERLLREFPQSPQALAARRRLRLMDTEEQEKKVKKTAIPRPKV